MDLYEADDDGGGNSAIPIVANIGDDDVGCNAVFLLIMDYRSSRTYESCTVQTVIGFTEMSRSPVLLPLLISNMISNMRSFLRFVIISDFHPV